MQSLRTASNITFGFIYKDKSECEQTEIIIIIKNTYQNKQLKKKTHIKSVLEVIQKTFIFACNYKND